MFDPLWYARVNPDIGAEDARAHYARVGRAQHRPPCPPARLIGGSGLFDPDFYLLQNADLRAYGEEPLAHYLSAGEAEGRWPNAYFNPRWYARVHAVTGGALLHYVLVGEAAGARPGLAFDPAWYRRAHGLAPDASPLAHWLRHRRGQRVAPNPLFDPPFYLARHGDEVGHGRDPFAHYLVVGAARGHDPNPWFGTAAYRAHAMRDAAPTWGDAAQAELANPLLHFVAHHVLARR